MQRFGQILGKSFGVPNGRSYGAEEVSSFAMTDPRQTCDVNSPEPLRQSVNGGRCTPGGGDEFIHGGGVRFLSLRCAEHERRRSGRERTGFQSRDSRDHALTNYDRRFQKFRRTFP